MDPDGPEDMASLSASQTEAPLTDAKTLEMIPEQRSVSLPVRGEGDFFFSKP